MGSLSEDKKTQQSKKSKDGEDSGSSSWMELAVGAALLSSVLRDCRNTKDKNNSSPDTSQSREMHFNFNNPKLDFGLFESLDEACIAVKGGKVSKIVEEFSDGIIGYTYIFKDSTDSENLILLRNISVSEREETFALLKQSGAEITGTTEISKEVSSISQQPVYNQPPIYEPFIWPSVTAGLGLLAYFKISKAGKWIRENLSTRKKSEDFSSLIERPKDRFSDIGGNRIVVAESKIIVEQIRQYALGNEDATVPKGILLSGPPGSGKTFLTRVIAGETGAMTLAKNATELRSSGFQGQWTGDTVKLFDDCRKIIKDETARLRSVDGASGREKAVLFLILEEFDAIAQIRNGKQDDETLALMNTLLGELEPFDQSKNDGLIVVAPTNRPDALDPAILRPGRFPIHLKFLVPETWEERFEILQIHTNKNLTKYSLKLEDSGDLLGDIAKISTGLTGDYLRNIVEIACSLCKQEGLKIINQSHFYEAVIRQIVGNRLDGKIDLERQKIIARHEHGHGIVATSIGLALHKLDGTPRLKPLVVSMVPRGNALGMVIVDNAPLMENPVTQLDALCQLLLCAGGRAGELSLGISSTTAGVRQDFKVMDASASVLVQYGLLDGRYKSDYLNSNHEELPDGMRSEIEEIGNIALKYAAELVNQFDESELNEMDSYSIGKEFVGSHAQDFYLTRFSQEIRERVITIIGRYFNEVANKWNLPVSQN